MEPSSERSHVSSAIRAHLDRGFRFEQAGSLERALEAYRQALEAGPTATEEIEARLRVARVCRGMADWANATQETTKALELAEALGSDDLVAEAMNVEVGTLQNRGLFEEADAIALAAIERAKSPRVRGLLLQNLGRGAAERGAFDDSDAYFAASIEAFRAADYDIGLAIALTNAGKAALDRGNAARALQIGEEAIGMARRLNMLDVLLTAVQNQAEAFFALGNLDAAESLLTEALGHFTSARNRIRQAECLEVMGRMNERRPGDTITARRCYERARELALEVGDEPLAARLAGRLTTLDTSRSANGAS